MGTDKGSPRHYNNDGRSSSSDEAFSSFSIVLAFLSVPNRTSFPIGPGLLHALWRLMPLKQLRHRLHRAIPGRCIRSRLRFPQCSKVAEAPRPRKAQHWPWRNRSRRPNSYSLSHNSFSADCRAPRPLEKAGYDRSMMEGHPAQLFRFLRSFSLRNIGMMRERWSNLAGNVQAQPLR